jgi:hypothetical protein
VETGLRRVKDVSKLKERTRVITHLGPAFPTHVPCSRYVCDTAPDYPTWPTADAPAEHRPRSAEWWEFSQSSQPSGAETERERTEMTEDSQALSWEEVMRQSQRHART